MKAAIEALPFEAPKLSASAIIPGQDFAALLEVRLKKRAREPKIIEAAPIPNPPLMVPDQRYRRA